MPTNFKGNKTQRRALNAFIALMRAGASVSTRVNGFLRENKLSGAQFGALEALFHLGALSQCDLAKKLLVTGGNITQLIDGLVKRGLVERKRSEEDRRVVTVELTSSGNRLMKKIMPAHVEQIVEEFSVLSASEQEELRRLCKIVGLGKEADIEES